jgi:hypothetical protein
MSGIVLVGDSDTLSANKTFVKKISRTDNTMRIKFPFVKKGEKKGLPSPKAGEEKD